ncbi:MAG: extracellular solute-binding protein [Treponema sp.]|jgi:ABC-type glycerol-3-phosphate transport system substrate-binding protein|nr:extracellular solute-binding protein [Treponema sp.]
MKRQTIRFAAFVIVLVFIAAAGVWASGSKDGALKEIIIGQFWDAYDKSPPKDELGERVHEWRTKIQKDHGITIKEKMIADWGNMLQTITTSVMAGKPAGQAFRVTPDWAMALHRQGLLSALSDSKAVDFKTSTPIAYKQVRYQQEIGRTFTFGGKQYAIAPGYPDHSVAIYFNKRLFKEAGLVPDLPYDMQKAGTWTWDGFFDVCKKLTRDRNNTGRLDTWAMPEDTSSAILESFVFSNGGSYIDKDASGKFVNASNRPEFIEAFNFCRRLRNEGVMMPRPEGANWDWYFSSFHDGQTAMMFDPEWRRQQISTTMADDWGYVLTPKGPKVNNYRFAEDDNVIVVPSTYKGEQLDLILNAVNLWFTPVSEDWKAGLWSAYRDRRAVDETMSLILTGGLGAFRMHMMIPGLEPGDIAWQMWWFDGEPAQLVESVSLSWGSLIADANK